MNKKLLTKAVKGNANALSELRQTVQSSLTVFVASGDTVDVEATLEAFAYFQVNGYPPDEWRDVPTLTLAQAFPNKVRRNPLNLKPITPGLWTQLWESENGPKLVAAIRWGLGTGKISDSSDLEIKALVRRHLVSPDPFLLDVLRAMERDETQCRAAMAVVYAPMTPTVAPPARLPASITPPLPRQQAQSLSMEDLKDEYDRGLIDVGRYLKLKASLLVEQAASVEQTSWSHEKYIALKSVLQEYFSLSEIRGLIFDMGLDRDNFSDRQNTAARELVQWAKRYRQLDKLSDLVRRVNPNRWMEFAAEWM